MPSADPVAVQRRVPGAASGTIGCSRTISVVRLLILIEGVDVERSVVQVGGKIGGGNKSRDNSVEGVFFFNF